MMTPVTTLRWIATVAAGYYDGPVTARLDRHDGLEVTVTPPDSSDQPHDFLVPEDWVGVTNKQAIDDKIRAVVAQWTR